MLQDGHRVVLTFQQEFNRLGDELSRVKTIEENRSSPSLAVANSHPSTNAASVPFSKAFSG